MPKAFDDCVKAGGKVRSVSGPSKRWGLKQGEYVHICFQNGEAHRGHTKSKKRKSPGGD